MLAGGYEQGGMYGTKCTGGGGPAVGKGGGPPKEKMWWWVVVVGKWKGGVSGAPSAAPGTGAA